MKKTKSNTTKIKTNIGYLNRKQIAIFNKSSSALNNAYYYDVLGYTNKQTELELSQIYFEVTGFQLLNWNCNSCRLNNWKKLGKLYYNSLDKLKQTTNENT